MFMMHITFRSVFFFLCVSALCLGANTCKSQERESKTLISKSEIEEAAKKRVFFGHQSVGENVLQGARALAEEQGVKVNIVKTRQPPAEGAGIFHFNVGANGEPDSKISDYANLLGAADFPDADVALVKLCYVDLNAKSDGEALAKTYASALDGLSKAHPKTRFVAVTSPLTRVETGAKAWVKGMIGRSVGQQENAVRQKFNAYLRGKFGPDRLYDLAKVESEINAADADAPALRPELTDDGGHLNDKGSRLAGAAFLKVIASSGK
jgi:hypothetical protein